jgi:hypothetical protein
VVCCNLLQLMEGLLLCSMLAALLVCSMLAVIYRGTWPATTAICGYSEWSMGFLV